MSIAPRINALRIENRPVFAGPGILPAFGIVGFDLDHAGEAGADAAAHQMIEAEFAGQPLRLQQFRQRDQHRMRTAGVEFHFLDANDAASYVQDLAGENANIIFGAKYDESMVDSATITVIATGLENPGAVNKIMPDLRYRPTAAVAGAGSALNRAGVGANVGYGANTQQTAAPMFQGIQKPRQPESTVQQVDIKIPDFLKNSRK